MTAGGGETSTGKKLSLKIDLIWACSGIGVVCERGRERGGG